MDVTDEQSVNNAIGLILSKEPQIDVLVNNAELPHGARWKNCHSTCTVLIWKRTISGRSVVFKGTAGDAQA